MSTTEALLIYDGDCGFCTRTARLAERLPVRLDLAPWQTTDLDALGIAVERVQEEIVLVALSGRRYGGADAVAVILQNCRGPWWLLGWVLALPVMRSVAAAVYRLVSANRHRLPGGTPACQLPPRQRPGAGRDG